MATNNSINANSTTPLPIVDGGTQVTSVTITPTATAFAGWDANKNLSANNPIPGYATTVSSATPIVLTVASAYQQYITGSTAQTVTMPVTSTLATVASGTAQSFLIVNNSSNTTTVNSSGGNLIESLPAGSQGLFTCISNSGTTAASWASDFILNVAGVSSITGTAHQVIASASSGAVTLSTPQNIDTTSSPTFAALTLTNPYIAGAGGFHSVQVLTSGTAATYTKPSNVSTLIVEVWGGGGGGGGTAGAAASGAGAGGGGAGGYAFLVITSAASTYTYTVGALGAGGTAGNNNGSTGGTTTFGASLQATGGGGGQGSPAVGNTGANFTAGGTGGVGSNGTLNTTGAPGIYGATVLGNVTSGVGGSGIYGSGGKASAAAGYGAGGGGATSTTTNTAGFNGTAGLIIVWEFA